MRRLALEVPASWTPFSQGPGIRQTFRRRDYRAFALAIPCTAEARDGAFELDGRNVRDRVVGDRDHDDCPGGDIEELVRNEAQRAGARGKLEIHGAALARRERVDLDRRARLAGPEAVPAARRKGEARDDHADAFERGALDATPNRHEHRLVAGLVL